ncbi:PTS sugar transporter subunit IIA [uncultured Anaerococcus sp.]|uniref:PTS sugar transporter subunit IIA n=1 Tax=uncultured Anaerococcus sp. TaxID=293428 RepID=UPI00288B0EB4|nr:PTS sugar transporter subunit IIA [uncultured Anaerococcus sp.]
MSDISNLTKEELIIIDNESLNCEEFFRNISNILFEKGYVEETFHDAIVEREKKYPTGLEMPKITVAIPHTDVQHIRKPFIFINKMKEKNIEFIQMGTDDLIVHPEFIVVLGIKEPKNQVGLLSSLMNLFDNEEFVDKIKKSDSVESMYKAFTE